MNFEQRKVELNQEAQVLKDRMLDSILKLANDFTQDWTRLGKKLAQLQEEEKAQDKLNPPVK